MENTNGNMERRCFERVEYVTPLDYKICKRETINKLLEGYTSNVSKSGILCRIRNGVRVDDIVWLSFDKDTLEFCHDLEKRCFIYQGGIIGCVVRLEETSGGDGFSRIGVRFLTREEGNALNKQELFPGTEA